MLDNLRYNLRSDNLRLDNLRSDNLRLDNLRSDNLRLDNLRYNLKQNDYRKKKC